MRTTCWFVAAALWLVGISSAHAQRRIRVGPTYSLLSLADLSGSSHSFSSFGGSAALITGDDGESGLTIDRKSTRLNSSHLVISYAVFCLKKKKNKQKLSLSPVAGD